MVFQLITEIVPREMRFPLASWADRTCAFHAQLAAATCLSLAAKVDETDVPLLLDLQVGKAARASTSSQSLSNGPHLLSQQRSFPGDMGIADDLGSFN